jgi:F5/8 type C domain
MNNDLSYVDVAQGKPASQSSLSQWSSGPRDAERAVAGITPDTFSFHTENEPAPWWLVDLRAIYEIKLIRVYNRQDCCFERAKTLSVETSLDGFSDWVTVHIDKNPSFLENDPRRPLEINLSEGHRARYVRCSLHERQYLHLARVQVLTTAEEILASAPIYQEMTGKYVLNRTSETSIKAAELSGDARFGNMLLKWINIILLAEKAGLRYVKLRCSEVLHIESVVKVGDLFILPPTEAIPAGISSISGAFFDYGETPFSPLIAPLDRPNEAEYCRIGQLIRGQLLKNFRVKEGDRTKELTIHLRAGDIFTDAKDVSGYRQPPLAFYILVIRNLLETGEINRVLLVFEDRGNPCVDALENFLISNRISYRTQSGALADDLAALIDAEHLVFGFGTFGYAACRLSNKIKTVHFFAPELCGSYAEMPVIDRVFCVSDMHGGYFRAFEDDWYNTDENRKIMLSYPVENLAISEVTA